MSHGHVMTNPYPASVPSNPDGLRRDIAYIEARLRVVGESGDCAYERMLIKTYEAVLVEKRQQLEQAAGGA
jgi:hypothetical protein